MLRRWETSSTKHQCRVLVKWREWKISKQDIEAEVTKQQGFRKDTGRSLLEGQEAFGAGGRKKSACFSSGEWCKRSLVWLPGSTKFKANCSGEGEDKACMHCRRRILDIPSQRTLTPTKECSRMVSKLRQGDVCKDHYFCLGLCISSVTK